MRVKIYTFVQETNGHIH